MPNRANMVSFVSFQISVEGIQNVRTVAALAKEEMFIQWYEEKLTTAYS